jgi:hypothetical protein
MSKKQKKRKPRFRLGPRDKRIIKVLNILLKELRKEFPEIKANKVKMLQKKDKDWGKVFGYYNEDDPSSVVVATRAGNGRFHDKWSIIDTFIHEAVHSMFLNLDHDHDEYFWKAHYKVCYRFMCKIYPKRRNLWSS